MNTVGRTLRLPRWGIQFITSLLIYQALQSFLVAGFAASAEELKAIPSSTLERADQYIIGKVGEEYFRDNYEFLASDSYAKAYDGGVEYFLYYEYDPLSRISGKQERIFVRMFDRVDYVPYDYVACVEDGEICEPTITRDKAIEIAAPPSGLVASPFTGEPIQPGEPQAELIQPSVTRPADTWTWKVSVPLDPGPICFSATVVYVNAVTGQPQPIGVSKACQ